MSEWMKNLVGFLMLASVTMQLLPNQKYEQYVRLFIGFLLMILVLKPVLQIRSADVFLEQKIQQFVQEQTALEKKIGMEGLTFREKSPDIYEKETEMVEIPEISRVEVMVDD